MKRNVCVLIASLLLLRIFEVTPRTVSLPLIGRVDKTNDAELLVERYCPLALQRDSRLTDPISRQYTDGPWGEALKLLDPAGPITSLAVDWSSVASVMPIKGIDRPAIREVRLRCGWVHNIEERWEAMARQVAASPSPFGDSATLANVFGNTFANKDSADQTASAMTVDGRFDLVLALQWALTAVLAYELTDESQVALLRQIREQLAETQLASGALR